MIEVTTKEPKDLEMRVKMFNDEFKVLLAKYKLVLGASAMLTPDGRIMAQPRLLDEEEINKAKQQNQKLTPA